MRRYSLLLRYGTNKFWLSPRVSIGVEESSDFDTPDQSSQTCGGLLCSDIQTTTYKFVLYFVGNCSLKSAWALYSQLVTFLQQGCTTDLILERRVQDEDPLVFKVTKAVPQMVDTITQFTQERILKINLALSLKAWDPSGAILVG